MTEQIKQHIQELESKKAQIEKQLSDVKSEIKKYSQFLSKIEAPENTNAIT